MPSEFDKTIRSMITFIEVEAAEKIEELLTVCAEEFNNEKNRIIMAAIENMRVEYRSKEEHVRLHGKVLLSTTRNKNRMLETKFMDDHISDVLEKARHRLLDITKNEENYKTLLHDLILQGLVMIMDNEVLVCCRKEDEALVADILPNVKTEFRKFFEDDLRIKINKKKYLTDASNGGVDIYGLGGKLRVANTLTDRLEMNIQKILPEIRTALFGPSKHRVFEH